VALYFGDCRELLPLLPADDGCHMLLADPPYGVDAKPSNNRRVPLPVDRIEGDQNTDTGYQGLRAARRALRPSRHGYTFGPFDLRRTGSWCAHVELVWDHMIHGMGDLTLPWGREHELIQFAKKARGPKAEAANGGLTARLRRGTVLRYRRPSVAEVRWVGEKPVGLLRELIESSSCIGETVLDPFVGSGSTMVAALLEGRRAIGIEINEAACEIAARRLAGTVIGEERSE
jgi:DNA modification methylase